MSKKEYLRPAILVREVRLSIACLSGGNGANIQSPNGVELDIFNQGQGDNDLGFGHNIGVDNNDNPFEIE